MTRNASTHIGPEIWPANEVAWKVANTICANNLRLPREQLSDRDGQIVRDYVYDQKSMLALSTEYGVSVYRVRKIIKRAFDTMRRDLQSLRGKWHHFEANVKAGKVVCASSWDDPESELAALQEDDPVWLKGAYVGARKWPKTRNRWRFIPFQRYGSDGRYAVMWLERQK